MTEEKAKSQETKHEFVIQRIYVKDLSFEAPNVPQIFQTEWAPQVDMNLKIDSQKLADDIHEVVLQITVTVKLKDKNAFLIELKQGGIFVIKGFTNEQMDPMLKSFCPNILFPYARETISETVARGSFPPLYLSPLNFDALYQQQLMEKQKEEKK